MNADTDRPSGVQISDELWDWVLFEDEQEVEEHAPEGRPWTPPDRARRAGRRRVRRRVWAAAALVVLAAGAVLAMVTLRPADRPSRPQAGAVQQPPSQLVVAWTVWDDEAAPMVGVLGFGGGRPPVALAFPGNAVVSIPGQGIGTVDEAAETGDVTVVAATVENVLGVRMDGAWGVPLEDLSSLVDEVGGIEAEGRRLDGNRTAAYLREPPARNPEERLIRWQEVMAGLLSAVSDDPEALRDVPDDVYPAVAAGPAEVVALPVEDVGAGLMRPEREAVERLVAERFLPVAVDGEVRLVVLNGNGIPGVGERVARILVPEGFRLISSQNAMRFDRKVTDIIASSKEYLPAARKARELLGVGRMLVAGQPSGVADVTVVVGRDFGGS